MKISLSLMLILSVLFSCNSQPESTKIKSNSIKHIITPQIKAKYKKVNEIPPPLAYKYVIVKPNSYAYFLTNLDLKTENNKVYLYNGELKHNQNAQFAVLKIDIGKRDLQQCADAVMRLRGEYLFSQKKYNDLHFNFLSDGKARYFKSYAKGNLSYKNFRKYMNYIFAYANTASLKNELHKVKSINNIKIGDVFIQKGKPFGHAITVMNIAINKNNEKVFMLSQSYMPAQDIHILLNPTDKENSPWYKATDLIITPEWTFKAEDLCRF